MRALTCLILPLTLLGCTPTDDEGKPADGDDGGSEADGGEDGADGEDGGGDEGEDGDDGGGDEGGDEGDSGDTGDPPPSFCEELGLPERAFEAPAEPGMLRGELAGDFTVPLIDGTEWTLSENWTGCESYVFLPHYVPISSLDRTSLWQDTDRFFNRLFLGGPDNVHYFFVVVTNGEATWESFAPALDETLAEVMSSWDEEERAWWEAHTHIVGVPGNSLDNWIPELFDSTVGYIGFGIDRRQQIRGFASWAAVDAYDAALASSGGWPWANRIYQAAREVEYYNWHAELLDRLDAETGVTTLPFYSGDYDGDGISDQDERFVYGTSWTDPDTDGGGRRDGDELRDGTDPSLSDDDLADADSDGLLDSEEAANGTPTDNPDFDEDGLLDGDEVYRSATDPTLKDSDSDGVDDLAAQGEAGLGYEVQGGQVVSQYVDGVVVFPDAETMAGFDTLELDIKMECPDPTANEGGNCGAWDYLAYLWLWDEAHENRVEMGRFITTYHRESRWVVDATHALGWLQEGGKRHLRYEWAPSWNVQPTGITIEVRLSNQGKGHAPREIVPLFGGRSYNSSYNDRDPVSVDIPADAAKVEITSIITGHGMDGSNNCAEFCNHGHTFSIDSQSWSRAFPEAEVQDACEADIGVGGTVPNQLGTWWFGRGGWCPGRHVDPWVIDATAEAPAGSTVEVRYTGDYEGGAIPDTSGNIAMNSWMVIHR
jgi:hypothetical protein